MTISPVTGLSDPGEAQTMPRLRLASLTDLEIILEIGLAAMPLDPQWNWRFQHRSIFPDDHRKFTREIYRNFLENRSGNWVVLLAEMLNHESGFYHPVAFAVWNLSNFTGSQLPCGMPCLTHGPYMAYIN
jgi:hypothetical protein